MRESSAKTWFICLQGSAHGAWKLRATTFVGPADLRNCWNSSSVVISCTAEDAVIFTKGKGREQVIRKGIEWVNNLISKATKICFPTK